MTKLKYSVSFIFLTLSFFNLTFSQISKVTNVSQTATTEDGKKVTLKSDGTWEYQAQSTTQADTKVNTALLSTEYDRFSDISTVTTSLDSFKEGASPFDVLDFDAKAEFQGKSPKDVKSFSLVLTYMNMRNGARIQDTDKAYLIADDNRFEIPLVYPSKKSWLEVEIPLDSNARKAIYNAKKTELKVGRKIIEFNDFHLEVFRNLFNFIQQSDSIGKSNAQNAGAVEKNVLKQTLPLKPKLVSSLLEVKTDKAGFLDVPVQADCLIGLSDEYFDGYYDARTTHHAFRIWDLKGQYQGIFYMKRSEKSEQLRKAIIDSGSPNPRATVIFVIKSEKFKATSSFFLAEIVGIK